MTAQIPDSLWMDDEIFHVMGELSLGPTWHRMPRPDQLVAPHTANWRGYVASWAIEDAMLHLRSVSYYDSHGPPRELVLDGVESLATWVTLQVRIANGQQVQHVHSGWESRYESEMVVDIVDGNVRSVEPLVDVGPYGSVGPYRLLEHIGGGAFGRVFGCVGTNGERIAAKVPDGYQHGDPWSLDATFVTNVDGRRIPLSFHAIAVADAQDGVHRVPITPALAVADLSSQHDLCVVDAGELLPISYGIWTHEPSGLPTLVMERLDPFHITSDHDIVVVLSRLADAVERGLFAAHGDLKSSHVVAGADGRIRLLDPAVSLGDGLRSITPLFNPQGWSGPAADVAACGWMMRYELRQPNPAWEWAHQVCDVDEPPDWALAHDTARDELIRVLEAGPAELPEGWTIPETPDPARSFLARARSPIPSEPAAGGSASGFGSGMASSLVVFEGPLPAAPVGPELLQLQSENRRLRATIEQLSNALHRIGQIAAANEPGKDEDPSDERRR